MLVIFFLMIRRPPRSTLDRSSAASDVYKRQVAHRRDDFAVEFDFAFDALIGQSAGAHRHHDLGPVSYTHLRAHETVLDLVCRLLLEKKTNIMTTMQISLTLK